MHVEFIKREKNPLLRREEILFEIKDIKATPSRKEILEKLSALLAKDKELIVVKNIKNVFGTGKAEGLAYLYDSKEILKNLEPEFILKRLSKEKEEKKEDANAAKEQA